MKRNFWMLLIGLGGALFLVVLATGFREDPNAISSPLVHKPAASFVLRAIDGNKTISLAQLRGRPVVLNFSASWCIDCRIDQEYLSAAWQKYAGKGVRFISVLYQDNATSMRSFTRQYGGGWPILRDPEQQTAINYGVYGVPETFFIDRHGIVRYKSTGPVPWNELNSQVQELLRSRA
jgi:cytochrome c biogenesis protein CcmG, thiol:disulfide interchange protein DsbE